MNLFSRLTRNISPRIEDFDDKTSRRQKETFLYLQSTHGVKLKRVVSGSKETLLVCDKNIVVDWAGLVSWDDTGFYPIEWSPFK